MSVFNGKYGICLGRAEKHGVRTEGFKWYTVLVEETREDFCIDEFEAIE